MVAFSRASAAGRLARCGIQGGGAADQAVCRTAASTVAAATTVGAVRTATTTGALNNRTRATNNTRQGKAFAVAAVDRHQPHER